MARSKHRAADESFTAAVAAGKTIVEAATDAGLSEQTAARRAADPSFRSRVLKARAGLVDAAAGKLAAGLADAAGVLRELLADPDPRVRLAAAGRMIDLALKVREHVDLTDELADLEQRIKAAETDQPPDRQAWPPGNL